MTPGQAQTLGYMIDLAQHSPTHKKWALSEAIRLFGPPIELGQYMMLPNRRAFCTWAYLTDEAAAGYADRTRQLKPADWSAGNTPWIIDLIAPFGDLNDLIREIRIAYPGHTAFAARSRGQKAPLRTSRFSNA